MAMGLERRDVLDEIAEDEEFEREVLDAEGEATEHVEEAVYQAAVSGSVAAAKLWLELRQPAVRNLPAVVEGTQGGLAGLNELMAGPSEPD